MIPQTTEAALSLSILKTKLIHWKDAVALWSNETGYVVISGNLALSKLPRNGGYVPCFVGTPNHSRVILKDIERFPFVKAQALAKASNATSSGWTVVAVRDLPAQRVKEIEALIQELES